MCARVRACVRARARACTRTHVHACVRACVRACTHARADVHAADDEGNTALVMARLGDNAGFEPPTAGDARSPYGRYWGRPIIGRDSRIDGGVYVGRKPREAIVVDLSKPGPVRDVYAAWLRSLQESAAVWPWQQTAGGQRKAVRKWLSKHLLAEVRTLVHRELPFDRHVVAHWQ